MVSCGQMILLRHPHHPARRRFVVSFSSEPTVSGPEGEGCYEDSELRIKVPLKVLAYQFAGNLGEN